MKRPATILGTLLMAGLLAVACGRKTEPGPQGEPSRPAEAPAAAPAASVPAASPAAAVSPTPTNADTAAVPGASASPVPARASAAVAPAKVPSSAVPAASVPAAPLPAPVSAAPTPTSVAPAAPVSAAPTPESVARAAAPAVAPASDPAQGGEGDKPYIVVDGYKVDPGTLEGFRTWRAAACDRCHGPNQEGLVGPALVESLKTLSKADFKKTLEEGRLEKGMPSWKENERVMKNLDNLYAYLKGRSDGAITRAKVEPIP